MSSSELRKANEEQLRACPVEKLRFPTLPCYGAGTISSLTRLTMKEKDSVQRFRILGFIEALSLLLLLFVAMPLKYMAGLPEVVSVVGMLHGVLFTIYVFAGLVWMEELNWNFKRLGQACLIASLPFGPFMLDRFLFPEQELKQQVPAESRV